MIYTFYFIWAIVTICDLLLSFQNELVPYFLKLAIYNLFLNIFLVFYDNLVNNPTKFACIDTAVCPLILVICGNPSVLWI